MAAFVTNEFRNAQLGAPTHSVLDLNTDNMDLSLLDETDSGTISATVVDYDEIDTPTVVATEDTVSPTIGSLGVGIYDIADTTFDGGGGGVTGDAADYLVLWKNSGTPATSPVAAVWDSATTGIPVQPNGGNIIVQWASGGVLQI